MSGILVAMVGSISENTVYAAGLYNTTTGVDLSPITGSATNTTLTRTWIGYFRPAATGSVTLSLQTTAVAGGFGGTATTLGKLWLGSTAVSGYKDSNANITATDTQTASTGFNLTAGVYYPVRIRWDGEYDSGFFGDDSSGSLTFLVSGSSNVTNRVYYNTLTNGF